MMMIRKMRIGMTLSLLAVASTLAVANPASADSVTTGCFFPFHGTSTGGSGFGTDTNNGYLAEVTVWYGTAGGFGNVVNGIEWKHCKNIVGGTSCTITSRGTQVGNGGRDHTFVLDWQSGERLTFVVGQSGVYLDGILFSTTHKTSQWFGGSGGSAWDHTAPQGEFLNAFLGTSGSIIDTILVCRAAEQ
jgi:hypothetical protein